MAEYQMVLCYITGRRQLSGNEGENRWRLLAKIAEAARAGVDYIQVREKDLTARELERLVRDVVAVIRQENAGYPPQREPAPGTGHWPRTTKLLINSRIDVALACGADGVHLRSDDLAASEARAAWMKSPAARLRTPVIGVSCHTATEVALAESHGADFVLFGPVFEKDGRAGAGLEALRQACNRMAQPAGTEAPPQPAPFPVFALGGVTLENARACVAAGAAGIAAIRLFQENDVAAVVRALRGEQS